MVPQPLTPFAAYGWSATVEHLQRRGDRTRFYKRL